MGASGNDIEIVGLYVGAFSLGPHLFSSAFWALLRGVAKCFCSVQWFLHVFLPCWTSELHGSAGNDVILALCSKACNLHCKPGPMNEACPRVQPIAEQREAS